MEVFIHTKDNLKRMILRTIIAIIPLYIYGIYKNGILPYNKDLISFIEILKPVYLILIGLVALIVYKCILRQKLKIDHDFLLVFLIPVFMPYSVNYIYYFLGIFVGLILTYFINKFFNFNKLAFIKLFIILILVLLGTYNYCNPAEDLNIYAFNNWDLLWGRSIGGIASTNIIFALAAAIYLSITENYKYMIFLSSIFFYLVLGIIIDSQMLVMGTNILSLSFVATDFLSSPIEKVPSIIYGSLIGIVGFFISKYVTLHEGIFISILICSILYEIVCKITKKVL